MSNDEEPRSLSVIIGQQIRRFREQMQLRQEDVAEAAKGRGLQWGRSSVASLESGSRNLSIEELAVLPVVISDLGGWDFPLIPRDAKISLTPKAYVDFDAFMHSLRGLFSPIVPMDEGGDPEIMRLGSTVEVELIGFEKDVYVARGTSLLVYMGHRIWNYDGEFFQESWTELARKVAKRLSRADGREVSLFLAGLVAHVLWGHGVNKERDVRAEGRGPYESARALQSVRGHVTRELIAEIQAEIDSHLDAIRECEDEFNDLAEDELRFREWKEGVYQAQAASRLRRAREELDSRS